MSSQGHTDGDVNVELEIPRISSELDTIATIAVTGLPHFVIFDLDETLIFHSQPLTLMPSLREILSKLKSNGHFLSVCSNNVMAKTILDSFGLLHLFDIVIGFPSTTFKSLEVLEICKYYRNLHRSHLIGTKLRTNRIIFVDNDEENTSSIAQLNAGIRVCNDILSCVRILEKRLDTASDATTAKPIRLLEREICALYHLTELPLPYVKKPCENGDDLVHLSGYARTNSNHYGTMRMNFHNKLSCGALKRCKSTIAVSMTEATMFGHSICKIC